MRILIIDSSAELSNAISDKLKEFGYQSDIAENIEDARYFLDIRNYNLVLVDWTLPSTNITDVLVCFSLISLRTSGILVLGRVQSTSTKL